MNVTKQTVINNIYIANPDVPKYKIARIVDLAFREITNLLDIHKKVSICNFGTFEILTKKETKVRHPKTKKLIIVPEKHYVKFTSSKNLTCNNERNVALEDFNYKKN